MVTVSDKGLARITPAILLAALISGCTAITPPATSNQALSQAGSTHKPNMRVVPATVDSLLPRQSYDAAGNKIPYVSQPNPYTTDTKAVPAEAKRLFVVADTLLKGGDLKGARTRFEDLAKQYPSLSGSWVKLGDICQKEQKYVEAVKQYENAIHANKNNVNAYIALALVNRRQGHISEAMEAYLRALKVWKDFPEAHLNLAILYDLYMNAPEEAQKHYEAYYFLVGEKDEKVRKWLVEVRQRTGIKTSFIDIPPKTVVNRPTENQADKTATVASENSI